MKISELCIGIHIILISQISSALSHKNLRSRHSHHHRPHHPPDHPVFQPASSGEVLVAGKCAGSKSCGDSVQVSPSPCPLCPAESHSPVCGSDGRFYGSDCDLRRRACLTKTHIFIVSHSCLLKNYYLVTPRHHHHHHHHHHQVQDYPAGQSENNFKNDNNNNNNNSSSRSLPKNLSKESRDQNRRGLEIESTRNYPSSNREQISFPKSATTVENEIQNDDDGKESCSYQDIEILRRDLFGLKTWEVEKSFGEETLKLQSSDALYWTELLGDGPERDKDHLLQLIFRFIDTNDDYLLQYIELFQADLGNVLSNLKSSKCQFRDFLRFDDLDGDGQVHVTEFYSGFSNLYGVTMISLEKALEKRSVLVSVPSSSVGGGISEVELRCDVTGSPPTPIKWKLPSHLSPAETKTHIRHHFDGSLRLVDLSLRLGGDYTCHSVRNEDVVQTHTLIVNESPVVQINPKLVMEYPGPNAMLTLDCEVQESIRNSSSINSSPIIWSWFQNNVEIFKSSPSQSSHPTRNNYVIQTFENGTSRCSVSQLTKKHMGTFTCQAQNSVGNGSDTATLLIIDPALGEKG